MKSVTTRIAAKAAGISRATLQVWIANGTVRAPKLRIVDGVAVRVWSNVDLARLRAVKLAFADMMRDAIQSERGRERFFEHCRSVESRMQRLSEIGDELQELLKQIPHKNRGRARRKKRDTRQPRS